MVSILVPTRREREENAVAHLVHRQIVSHTILPPSKVGVGCFFGVLSDPFVDVLEDHAVVFHRHERLVDKLGIRSLVRLGSLIRVLLTLLLDFRRVPHLEVEFFIA